MVNAARQNYRSDLDGLRAIAIIPVLLFHAGLGPGGGFVGVDVFFALSGYLIAGILIRDLDSGVFTFRDFYHRRVRRLFPAMLVLLAAITAVAAITLTPAELTEYGRTLIFSSTFAANVGFSLRDDYFTPIMRTAPLLHLWSLSIEEQFYLFFPLLLFGLAKLKLNRFRMPIVGVLTLCSLAASCYGLDTNASKAYLSWSGRAFEIGLGALTAFWVARPAVKAPPRRILQVAGLLGLGLIAFAALTYTASTPFPGLNALPPCLGACLVILSSQYFPSLSGRLLGWRPLTVIGRRSYSLYLWHWPVLAFARLIIDPQLSPPVAVAALALSAGLACLTYRFVEVPARTYAKPKTPQDTQYAMMGPFLAWAVMQTIVFVLVGKILVETGGLEGRDKRPDIALAQAQESRAFQTSPCLSRTADLPPRLDCTLRLERFQTGPTLVLWGDSYATHLRPMLETLAAESQSALRILTKAGCRPLGHSQFLPHDPISDSCGVFNVRALAEIEQAPAGALVIIAGRWDLLADGRRLITQDGRRPSLAQSNRLFAKNLRRTLQDVLRQGKRVILVGQSPAPEFDPAACALRQRLIGLPAGGCALIVSPEMARTHDRINQILQAARAGLSPVGFIDPYDALCRQNVCQTLEGTQSLYLDDTHLSALGALRLAPLIRNASDVLRR